MSTLSPIPGRAVFDLWVNGQSVFTSDRFVPDTAVCTDSVFQGRSWTMQIQAVSIAAYETFILPQLLSEDRDVQVRWGIDVGSQTLWQPLENFRILTAQPSLHTAAASSRGHPFKLVLADALYEMELQTRVIARNGRISDLVAEIASDYDLDTAIEPTGGAPVTLVQSYESDLSFLRRRLLPSATNMNGIGGYYLYIDNGVLHFHTRDWHQSPWILPYNLMAGGAAHLLVSDNAQIEAQGGGQDSTLVTFDPLAGRTEVTNNDPQRYTRFGPRLSKASGSSIAASHVGPNQLVWETAQQQSIYSWRRDRFEQIAFSMANAPMLRAGLIVVLQLPDRTAAANGPYHVETATLTISGGGATTTVSAARGELAGRPSDTGVRGVQTGLEPLPAPSAAPGRDPNFQIAASAPSLGEGATRDVRPAG